MDATALARAARDKGWVTPSQVEECMAICNREGTTTGERLGQTFVRKGYLTPAQLRQLLAVHPPSGAPALPSVASRRTPPASARKALFAGAALETQPETPKPAASTSPKYLQCPTCNKKFVFKKSAPGKEPLCRTCSSFLIPGPPSSEPKSDPRDSSGEPFGSYRLLEVLGKGAMGVVWKAWHPELKCLRAVKQVIAKGETSASRMDGFLAGARGAAKLHHPNIVPVHEVDVENGVRYFTMDLVEGCSLREFTKEGLPLTETLDLVRQIADGLEHAHERGVVHNDVKPENVMVDDPGRPYLVDFGLYGTPAYMSPERITSKNSKERGAGDQFSLGVMLYEMLAGDLPFQGDNLDDLRKAILKNDPRAMGKDVPRDVKIICLKTLEKDPANRYSSLGELSQELTRYLEGEPIKARPLSRTEWLWRKAKKHRKVILALAAALLLSVTLGTWSVVSAVRHSNKIRTGLQCGAQLETEGKPDGARDAFKSVLALDPNNAEAKSGLQRVNETLERLARELDARKAKEKEAEVKTFETKKALELKAKDNEITTKENEFKTKELNAAVGAKALEEKLERAESERLAGLKQGVLSLKPLVSLQGHAGPVSRVGFNPEGNLLYSVEEKAGTVRFWDLSTGKEAASHPELQLKEPFLAAGFAEKDKLWLVTNSIPGAGWVARGRLWEAKSGQESWSISREAFASAQFSSDGAFLAATGKVSRSILVRNSKTGEIVTLPPQAEEQLSSVAMSSDGGLVAATGSDGFVRVWEVAGRKLKHKLPAPSGAPSFMVFSPEGSLLAGGGGSGISIWDLTSGSTRVPGAFPLNGVQAAAFTADAKILALGGIDGKISLRDVKTGKEIRTLEGHASSVQSLLFSPKGTLLASGSADKTVRLWGLELVPRTESGGAGGAPSKELSPAPWWELLKPHLLEGHGEWIYSAAFSKDGKMLATASGDTLVKLWDTTTFQPKGIELRGHNRWVLSVAFSPDGATVATGSYDKLVKLWNPADGKLLATFPVHPDRVNTVAYSLDGRTIASGGGDSTIRLWRIGSTREPELLKGHAGTVHSLAFSPDGKSLASAGADQSVRLWDLGTKRTATVLSGHTGAVFCVAYSADGKLLATAGEDHQIIIRDGPTGKERNPLRGHSAPVLSVSFSPDGAFLASGGRDKTVRLWDLSNNRSLTVLRDHTEEVQAVAFSPVGRMLVSASADKTARLWVAESPR